MASSGLNETVGLWLVGWHAPQTSGSSIIVFQLGCCFIDPSCLAARFIHFFFVLIPDKNTIDVGEKVLYPVGLANQSGFILRVPCSTHDVVWELFSADYCFGLSSHPHLIGESYIIHDYQTLARRFGVDCSRVSCLVPYQVLRLVVSDLVSSWVSVEFRPDGTAQSSWFCAEVVQCGFSIVYIQNLR